MYFNAIGFHGKECGQAIASFTDYLKAATFGICSAVAFCWTLFTSGSGLQDELEKDELEKDESGKSGQRQSSRHCCARVGF